MSDHKTILIAGCGYLGEIFAHKCLQKGHSVTGIRRQTSHFQTPELIPLALDMAKPFELEQSYNWVVFCAAPSQFGESAYEETYVKSLSHLMAALKKHPTTPEAYLFVSSTGVYGQVNGEDVDEDSPTNPTSFSGQTMLKAEALLQQPSDTILRLGGIYGHGRMGFIERLKARPILNQANPYSNRIHSEDAAGIMLYLLENKLTGIYNGVDSSPTPINDVITWMAQKMSLELIESVDTQVPKRRGNKKVSNQKLLKAGYSFKYPSYMDGYGEFLEGAPS